MVWVHFAFVHRLGNGMVDALAKPWVRRPSLLKAWWWPKSAGDQFVCVGVGCLKWVYFKVKGYFESFCNQFFLIITYP